MNDRSVVVAEAESETRVTASGLLALTRSVVGGRRVLGVQASGLDGLPPSDVLMQVGPRIQVVVRPHPQYGADAARSLTARSLTVSAGVDTMARLSGIDVARVAVPLSLQVTRTIQAGFGSGPAEVSLYAVSLALDGDVFNLEAAGLNLGDEPEAVVFGRDVLRKFALLYDGPLGAFALFHARQP